MEWVVVEFTEEGSVEVIPKCWCQEFNCAYWPPVRGSKLKQAIINCEEPDKEKWDLCLIRLLGRTYNTYSEACSKAKKAELTSDINTDSEEPKKRNRIKNRKFSNTSDDSDVSTEVECADLPAVPKIELKPSAAKASNIKTSSTVAQKAPIRVQSHSEGISKEKSVDVDSEISYDVLQKIFKQLSYINQKIDDLQGDMTRIRTLIENKQAAMDVEEIYEFQFPIKDSEALLQFEENLKNEAIYKNYVGYVRKIGGNNAYDSVKRVLSRIITNSLAANYSWLGAKGKQIFGSLLLTKGLLEGVQSNQKNATEQEIEIAIKNWLRHAKQREQKNK